MVTVLRPLSTSELLDRTFHLYRNNFVLFVGIAALPQLAVLVLRLTNTLYIAPSSFAGRIAASMIVGLSSFIAIEIAHAATVMAVSDLHPDRGTSIGAAYGAARNSLLRVVGISIAVVVIPVQIALPIVMVLAGIAGAAGAMGLGGSNVAAIRLGSILMVLAIFLLPLRWWLAWSLIVPVTVLEGGGLRTSMRRSKNLTRGSRGQIFLVYLLLAVLTWVVNMIFELPFFYAAGLRAFRNPNIGGPLAQVLLASGNVVSTSLLGALLTIAFTLIYYDQRVRKQGFDLQLMMATLQPSPQPAAAVSTA